MLNLKIIGVMLIALFFVGNNTTSAAEIEVAPAEIVLAKKVKLNIGLVCNKLGEVKQFVDLIDSGLTTQQAVNLIEGCGGIQFTVYTKVTAIAKYRGKTHVSLFVRYNFYQVKVHEVQYGIYKIKPIRAGVNL